MRQCENMQLVAMETYAAGAQDHGVFLQKTEQKTAQEQLMSNPEVMTDMLKKNMGGIVPQVSPLM